MSIVPENIKITSTHNAVGEFDFDFLGEDIICSIGQDGEFKQTQLSNLQIIKEMEISNASNIIATSPKDLDTIIIAYDKQVDKINEFQFDMAYPTYSASFEIQKVLLTKNSKVCAYLHKDSNLVKLQNLENDKLYNVEELQSIVLNGQFSYDSRFLALTCQDGFCYIYSVQDLDSISLSQKISIGSEVKDVKAQKLGVCWYSKENAVFLPGQPYLQIASVDEKWQKRRFDRISHQNPISLICQLDDLNVLTIDTKNELRISNIQDQKTIFSYKFTLEVINKVLYSSKHNTLIFSDDENSLNYWTSFNANSHDQANALQQQEEQKIQQEYKQQEEKKMQERYEQLHKKVDNKTMELEDDNNDDEQELKQNVEQLSKEEKLKQLVAQQRQKKQQEEEQNQQVLQTPTKGNGETNVMEQEEQIMRSNKKLQKKYFQEQIGGMEPQSILYPTSTRFSNNCRYICNNLVGSIVARREDFDENNEMEPQMLEFEFYDKGFHQNMYIKDTYNVCMGCMNLSGAFLASRGLMQEHELEEDNEQEILNEKSVLIYKQFKHEIEKNEWVVELDDEENAECVAIGNNWCAVATDLHYFKIYNQSGIQTFNIKFQKPIVSLVGYENFLVYVYHDSLPVLGCQNLKMDIYDVSKQMSTIYEGVNISLGPKTELSYIGFSEQGLLIIQDNKNYVNAFVNGKWQQIQFELKNSKKLWCVGMDSNRIQGIILDTYESYPTVNTKKIIYDIEIGTTLDYIEQNYDFNKIAMKKLLLEHERFRTKHWIKYKICRGNYHNLNQYSKSILDSDELQQKSDEIDKELVFFFKDQITQRNFELAYQIVESEIQNVEYLRKCYILCQKLDVKSLLEPLNQIIEEKQQLQRFEKNQKSSLATKLQNTVISNNQPNKQVSGFNINNKLINKGQSQSQQLQAPQQQFNQNNNNYLNNSANKNRSSVEKQNENSQMQIEENEVPTHNGKVNPFAKKSNIASKPNCLFENIEQKQKNKKNPLSLFGNTETK